MKRQCFPGRHIRVNLKSEQKRNVLTGRGESGGKEGARGASGRGGRNACASSRCSPRALLSLCSPRRFRAKLQSTCWCSFAEASLSRHFPDSHFVWCIIRFFLFPHCFCVNSEFIIWAIYSSLCIIWFHAKNIINFNTKFVIYLFSIVIFQTILHLNV